MTVNDKIIVNTISKNINNSKISNSLDNANNELKRSNWFQCRKIYR